MDDFQVIAWRPDLWIPDGDACSWYSAAAIMAGLDATADFIRPPRPEVNYETWLQAARQLRSETRGAGLPSVVHTEFVAERAWVRLRDDVAKALALEAGETVTVSFDARHISGATAAISIAFDFVNPDGGWAGWSAPLADISLPEDGEWHPFSLEAVVPKTIPANAFCRLIVGEDGLHGEKPSVWELRNIAFTAPEKPSRRQAVADASTTHVPPPKPLDLSTYERPDLAWARRNFACYFLFMYDSLFYDREASKYRVEEFLAAMDQEFGGVDSVVLWQAYPVIGLDQRNQFDFYRDMPGGLDGLRRVVDQFHAHGVKVYTAYNPWDESTRREPHNDLETLAEIAAKLDADGVFLDTMDAIDPEFRALVDRRRPGVVFEPEGQPPIHQLPTCNASWSQWMSAYRDKHWPGPGSESLSEPEPCLLRIKWIEPRHMQHQIRRWHPSRQSQIEVAFFNGSGILIWENVFGSFNPWPANDRAFLRRAGPILRAFAGQFASDAWEPFVPTAVEGLYAHRWPGAHCDLYTLWNQTGRPVAGESLRLRSHRKGARAFDLWTQEELPIEKDGWVEPVLGRVGAIAVAWDQEGTRKIEPLMALRHRRPENGSDRWLLAKDHNPKPVQKTSPAGAAPNGMVPLPAASVTLSIQHLQRECGCYPDIGIANDEWLLAVNREAYFTTGCGAFDVLSHHFGPVDVGPIAIDETLVTNREFAEFLAATGYRPADATNFLKHWLDGRLPSELGDHPVVYVSLDDARAFAAWAGKRLPTEPEWQLAGQGLDGRAWPWGADFDATKCNGTGPGTTPVTAFPSGRSPFGCYDMAGNVWQWTESERDDGHTRYAIVRGGSYFDATSSGWYIAGGARPLNYHAKVLLMYPGLERFATVGFRCVRDL